MSLVLEDLVFMPSQGADTNLDYNYAIEPFNDNISYHEWEDNTYSTVGFRLTLKKHFIKHLVSYYFPSLMFVLVSWISFLPPPQAVPGRMGLLITLLLVLVNLFGTVIHTQPSTKYLTYLNVWMITCIIFVCGPLFAYAVLLFHLRAAQSALESITIVKPDKEIPLIIAPNYYWRWDKICLTFFPLAFLLFNSVYWPVIAIN